MTNYQLPNISAEDAIAALNTSQPPVLIDVRKEQARGAIGVQGAIWINPMTLDHQQASAMPRGSTLIYCVHGHEVSQFACALARIHGVDAKYVIGGFAALAATGARMEDFA
ncbi:Rhodanese-related sulfurtransferase [Monaibacterium marinum]|uniref:Rhodanese-related sulfurtransferase n=1 Tax=Pontivivens marinum TaxID=1690039 RepID=A0A2C9CQE8_9RHOB|nr:rhodanese-like domain-containing protein [Monaibacterium marinum]SOH93405.1 Rhodanese-related sulfurtransferase [Monaibacterium marinum]